MKLFDRHIRVVLIRENRKYEEIKADLKSGKNYYYVDTISARESRHISTKLKIKFDIELSKSSKSDWGSVSIFNPNDETSTFIDREAGGIIEVYAGYGDAESLIFRGQVGGTKRITAKKTATDKELKFDLGSYVTAVQGIYIRKTWAGDIPVAQIIRDCLDENFIEHSGLEKIPNYIALSNFSYSGSLTALIDKLSTTYKLYRQSVRVYWQNCMLIAEYTKLQELTDVHHISLETGLMTTPTFGVEGDDFDLKFKMMLDPSITRGSQLRIKSVNNSLANGDYSVSRIKFVGSNWDEDHYMEIEAKHYATE